MNIKLKLVLAFVAALALPVCAVAQTTSAQPGVVVAVAAATATAGQTGYQQAVYRPESNAGTIAGGVLGAAVGAIAGRHMSGGGQWAAGSAGGAIGALVGRMADRRVEERQQQPQAGAGQQVIVRLEGGQTVAVFSRQGGIFPGQKVWIVGGSEIIPVAE